MCAGFVVVVCFVLIRCGYFGEEGKQNTFEATLGKKQNKTALKNKTLFLR